MKTEDREAEKDAHDKNAHEKDSHEKDLEEIITGINKVIKEFLNKNHTTKYTQDILYDVTVNIALSSLINIFMTTEDKPVNLHRKLLGEFLTDVSHGFVLEMISYKESKFINKLIAQSEKEHAVSH
jgi:hypothetical protein